VSCLPDIHTTEELLQKLRAKAASQNSGNSTETPFATAVEKAVLDEWFGDARVASQLPALSAKFDLNECPWHPNATHRGNRARSLPARRKTTRKSNGRPRPYI
jgi:hypothetical protein